MTPREDAVVVEAAARLRKKHREVKTWPLVKNDRRRGADGYIHRCNADGDDWPCDTSIILSALSEPVA